MKTILLCLAVCVSIIILVGCSSEELDCPVEDRYISMYEKVEYPSGDVYWRPIYACHDG